MPPDILLVISTGLAIALVVVGLYNFSVSRKQRLAQRIRTYAETEEETERSSGPAAPADRTISGPLWRVLLGRSYLERLAQELMQADVPMRASEYLLLQVVLGAAGFLIGFWGTGFLHSGLILGLLGPVLPTGFLRLRQRQRRVKFARQLADALMLLVSSLRSGYSFLKGIELVAAEMDDPIAKELKRTLREVQLGSTVDQALLNLAHRVNNSDLEIVVSAFLVQRDVGGNLTELMEKVAETIRERLRIEGDIRVLTAQGRISGAIVTAVPIVVFVAILLINPGYFAVMFQGPFFKVGPFTVPLGMALLSGAVVLQAIGALWIYRIISIKL